MMNPKGVFRALLAARLVYSGWGACVTPLDCQNNGDCVDYACVCDRGWTGSQCSTLKEGRSWVLWPETQAQPITAGWGASVLRGADGRFHMFATVVDQMAPNGTYMTCYHTQATQVVHATASDVIGPYDFSDVAIGPEANCPHAVRTGDGGFAIFHNNDNAVDLPLLTCTGVRADGGCEQKSGSTTPCGTAGVGTIGLALAAGPQGPWNVSYPLCDFSADFDTMSNPSAHVDPADGSVTLALRYFAPPVPRSNATREAIAVFAAPGPLGPYTILNRDVTAVSAEDPFLYKNSRGFHMLAHQYNCSCPYGDPNMIPGLHLFSDCSNASAWHTAPLPPYTNAVVWANGTRALMNYRERPELLLDDSGSPAYLITGTEWGHKYKFPLDGGPCQSVAMITEIMP